MKQIITDIDRQVYERKMEQWRYDYPFTAAMMSGITPTEEQVIALVKLGKERRSNE